MAITEKIRCAWGNSSEVYRKYHDEEWGVPCHDERKLFEMLLLEGQQAGLSWITILNKRKAFREAFDDFDPKKIAVWGEHKTTELLQNTGIIRNRLKIKAATENAKAYFKLIEEFGSLDNYLWSWVGHKPIKNHWNELSEVPARTKLSDKLSKDLKKRGFKFVGSTIIYAFMQAVGMVDDHVTTCFKYKENKPTQNSLN